MRLFENANYDFWSIRKTGFAISGVLLALALVGLVYPGLKAGIDFRGGTEMVFQLDQPVDLVQARQALEPVLGNDTEIKQYGSATEILVRSGVSTEDMGGLEARVAQTLASTFSQSEPDVIQVNAVGPRFADDLYRGAFYSVIGGLLVILLYVLARYDWRYGVGAILTIGHDILVILGIFAFLNAFTPLTFTITQTIIAALLTIVGYSVNDTVIVYDRIRETIGLFRTEAFSTVANRAINATLSRTIVTSGTTLIPLTVLLIFGGEELRGFSLALIIGILLGTYSSIFVSAPLVVLLREKFPVRKRIVAAR